MSAPDNAGPSLSDRALPGSELKDVAIGVVISGVTEDRSGYV